jgi:glyoxylase-like metal-dependent hydrolase (beta-lactamase superfamily II)
MRVRVLGCSGGSAPGKQPSCYLLDNGVSIEDQQTIRHVFLTHAHWDHVRDLPLHTINRSPDLPALVVHGLPETVHDIRTHLMNDRVWFSAFELPSPQAPYIASEAIEAGTTIKCAGYKITAIAMPHTVPAIGYLVDDGTVSVLLCADTGGGGFMKTLPTTCSPLKAVFLETSFPNAMRDFAVMTGHLTPEMLGEEVACLPEDVKIIATHMKPGFEDLLRKQLAELGRRNVSTCVDGDTFNF